MRDVREEDPWLNPITCTAMMRLGTRMAAVFDQHFAAMGITQAQFRTLLAVGEVGGEKGIAPSDLAEYLLLDRATVTLLTARLVEAGYLERLPGVNRRTHLLRLTAQGLARVEEVGPHAMELADVTLAHMTPEETRTLLSLLDRLEVRVRAFDPKTLTFSKEESE